MKKSYGRTIWRSLNEYAVWQPGSYVQIGDYGVMDNGCFKRIGNISEFIEDLNFDLQKFQQESVTIKSDRSNDSWANLTAAVRLLIEYQKNFGVLLVIKDSQIESAINLQQLSSTIAGSEKWNRSWFLVTTLRKASEYSLHISKGKSAAIEGSAKDIEQFLQGNLQLSSSISFKGDFALEIKGKDAPVSVGLHRLRRKGDSFRNLENIAPIAGEDILAPYYEAVAEEEE